MTDAAFKCANCGAVPRSRARFCEYCGAPLAFEKQAEPAAAEAGHRGPFGDVDARFAALEADESTQGLLQLTPDLAALNQSRVTGWVVLSVALIITIAAGVVMSAAFGMLCPPLMLLPIALIGFAIYGLVHQMRKLSKQGRAPVERYLALVADERTKISNGLGDNTARAHHFVTLQFSDGKRMEIPALETIPGMITQGDMGVAYLQGNLLIEFKRVSV